MEQIQFSLQSIRVNTFDIINKRPPIETDVNIEWGINFNLVDNQVIQCQYVSHFNSSNDPWLTFVFDSFIEFHQESFQNFKAENGSVVLPKQLASHLAAITVSTARGALLVLTQNTAYFDQIMPLMNVAALFVGDVVIEPNSDSI